MKNIDFPDIDPTKFTVTETGQVIKPHKPSITDEEIEKQAEIECKKLLQSEKGYNGISFQEFWEEGAKWGLAEGRKESKEYIRYLKRQRQGGIQKQYNKISKIKELEKENSQLKSDLEEAWTHCKAVDDVNAKLRCCGNCKHSCSTMKCFNCVDLSNWEMGV